MHALLAPDNLHMQQGCRFDGVRVTQSYTVHSMLSVHDMSSSCTNFVALAINTSALTHARFVVNACRRSIDALPTEHSHMLQGLLEGLGIDSASQPWLYAARICKDESNPVQLKWVLPIVARMHMQKRCPLQHLCYRGAALMACQPVIPPCFKICWICGPTSIPVQLQCKSPSHYSVPTLCSEPSGFDIWSL